MGPQFQSRLNPSDLRRIQQGIRQRVDAATRPKKAGQKPIGRVQDLPARKRRELGDQTVGYVLSVADGHNFFKDFEESHTFRETLDFLKQLYRDAAHNGFKNSIRAYNLERGSPTAALSQHVLKITRTEGERPNQFRTEMSTAAKMVIIEAIQQPVAKNPNESKAEELGRQFAAFDLRKIVTRFVENFIGEFVRRTIAKADKDQVEQAIQDALALAQNSAERIARRAMKKIERKGQLTDAVEIHKMVTEELKALVKTEAAEAQRAPAPEE